MKQIFVKPQVLLSFDVEEFDIPLEYNHFIDAEKQMQIGKEGFDNIMSVIEKQGVSCTMFTTANFALHFPAEIKNISDVHEIASHSFYHSVFSNEHLLQSKESLEKIINKQVTGFRMLRMGKVDINQIKQAGYLYDSSIHPTLIPGKYNNLNLPRTVHIQQQIVRLPASVSPKLRLPLFWLAFKSYPYKLFLYLCRQCLQKDGYVCLYFHPWEFANINEFKLPGFVKKPCGKQLLKRLDRLINDLKNDCDFSTIQKFISVKGYLSKEP